jgi:hypothetical protein
VAVEPGLRDDHALLLRHRPSLSNAIVTAFAARVDGRAAATRTLPSMGRKKVTIRPPGLKPTTKVGTFGPYRGRLGVAWVVAPIVVGALILLAGYLALR